MLIRGSVLWVLSAIFVGIYLQKHRANTIANTSSQAGTTTYTGGQQAVAMENKYEPVAQQPAHQHPQQQQPYTGAQPPHPQAQHVQQPGYNPQQQWMPYPQDPVNRGGTVSPVSSVGYNGTAPPPNASELSTPHHYNPNVSELSYNPNASELSTPHHTGPYNPNLPELSTQK